MIPSGSSVLTHLFINDFKNYFEALHQVDQWQLVVVPFCLLDNEDLEKITKKLKSQLKKLEYPVTSGSFTDDYMVHTEMRFANIKEENAIFIDFSIKM